MIEKIRIFCLVFGFILAVFMGFGHSYGNDHCIPYDIDAAKEICDSIGITGPEGIWHFEEDNVTVAILRDNDRSGIWNIIAVESNDRSIYEGDIIGWLQESPEPNKFKLNLFTKRKRGKLCIPQSCKATYSDKNESMIIERQKIKFSFNPLGPLSKFWRGLSIRFDNSGVEVPKGMIRIYPGYDGNGSSKRKPRYL